MRSQLRIALFYNLKSGGAKRAIYEWVKRLGPSHTLDVYTLSSADHTYCDIRPLVHDYFVFNFTLHNLFNSPFGRLNPIQRWRDLNKLSEIGAKIAHQINVGNYDIVFIQPCLFTFIPSFVSLLKVPSVYYLHEPIGKRFNRKIHRPYLFESKWRERLNKIDPLLAAYNRRLENILTRNIPRISQFLANSRFTQECIQQTYGCKSLVCYLGVNSEDFQPIHGVKRGDFVLSVGQLTPRKGFDFLIESIAYIPSDKRPELKLVCNLSPSRMDTSIHELEQTFLCDMANRLGVKINIITNLNSTQLAYEYNKAKLCVYSPVLEPFGLVPLEAMSCGTPVVGVNEAGVPESIIHEHTGLLVNRDPKEFGQAIQSLLEDQDRLERLGRQARDHILEHWTWDRSVANLEGQLKDSALSAP